MLQNLSRALSPALVAQYQTQLPDKRLLAAKLHEFYALGALGRRSAATGTGSSDKEGRQKVNAKAAGIRTALLFIVCGILVPLALSLTLPAEGGENGSP